MRKLKPSEVREFRQELLKKQGGLCTLCKKPIAAGQDTLDHCHDSGRVRAVLHRNCNGIEGRIKSWVRRSGCDPIAFLEAVAEHWTNSYDEMPEHPNHRNDIEKEIIVLKRKKKRLKTRKAKQRYTKRIQELEDENKQNSKHPK